MNNVLQRFHRYALSRTVWPLSISIGAITAVAWQLAPDSAWSRIISPLTSAAAVGGVFLWLEKRIRLHLWRIAYPELDFAGTWSGSTQYDHQQVKATGDETTFAPFKKLHEIRFKQDCLNIAVDYDETADYHGWNSTVATLVTESKGRVGLRYAYEVQYRQGAQRDARLPVESKGLEEVFVVDSQKGHRPRRITGTFTHTADGPRPRYSGTVAFEREIEESEASLRSRLLRLLVTKWLKPPAE